MTHNIADIQHQTYDNHGNPLCTQCANPISHGDKYIEIRQRINYSDRADDHLAAHLMCFHNAMYPTNAT